MLTEEQINELVLTLQASSPLGRLSWMEAATVVKLMEQRGWKITAPKEVKANG